MFLFPTIIEQEMHKVFDTQSMCKSGALGEVQCLVENITLQDMCTVPASGTPIIKVLYFETTTSQQTKPKNQHNL